MSLCPIWRTPPQTGIDQRTPEPPPAPQSHPAAAPTPSTAIALAPDPPPVATLPPTSSDLPAPQPSKPHPHIPAPTLIEEAKEIDLHPARDIKTTAEEEGGNDIIKSEASDVVTTVPRADIKPKTENETGMSATSGPMGDHMAEVWRDSDVGVKEGRPGLVEGKIEGVEEGTEGDGKGEGGMF